MDVEQPRQGLALEALLVALVLGALLERQDGVDERGATAELLLGRVQGVVQPEELGIGTLSSPLPSLTRSSQSSGVASFLTAATSFSLFSNRS